MHNFSKVANLFHGLGSEWIRIEVKIIVQETKTMAVLIMLKGSWWPRIAGGSLLRDCRILQRTEWGRRRGRGRQDTCHTGTCTYLSVHRKKNSKNSSV
jgi:hypothetical protein